MSDHEEENIDLVFGKSVAKGALIGLPVTLVFMIGAVWLGTDQALGDSITTALLSGILLGVFGGGFLGAISAMNRALH